MLSDLTMISHKFPGDIIIYPIADVHLGAAEHNAEAWAAMTREILKQPNAYMVLNGDLLNNCTRSSVSNIFEETMRPRDAKRLMVQMLEPLRDRILCITTGNHERRSMKDADDDPTYDIACKLDLEDVYRQNIAFLALRLGSRGGLDAEKATNVYTLAVTHGAGGGIYTGAAVNRNERFGNIIDGLDILIVGHTHKGTVTRPSKLVIDMRNGKVEQRDYVVISAVSWMEYGGYAAQKMLLPSGHSRPQKLLLGCNTARDRDIQVIW